MTQDQNKPDQDVENTSSEGNSTDTLAHSSKVDAQATAEQQSITGTDNDTEFFSYSEQPQTTETTEPNPKKSAVVKVVSIIVLIFAIGFNCFWPMEKLSAATS